MTTRSHLSLIHCPYAPWRKLFETHHKLNFQLLIFLCFVWEGVVKPLPQLIDLCLIRYRHIIFNINSDCNKIQARCSYFMISHGLYSS